MKSILTAPKPNNKIGGLFSVMKEDLYYMMEKK